MAHFALRMSADPTQYNAMAAEFQFSTAHDNPVWLLSRHSAASSARARPRRRNLVRASRSLQIDAGNAVPCGEVTEP